MRLGKWMKSGGVAALAAGLAVTALPANAQERGQGGWNRGGGAATATNDNRGSNWRGEQPGTAPAPQATAAPQPQAQRDWTRGNGRGGDAGDRWRGRDGSPPQVQAPARPPAQVQVQPERRNWSGNGQRQWQGRSRDARDPASGPNRNGRGDAARWRGNNDANRWNGNNNNWNGNNDHARDHAWRGRNDYAWSGDRPNHAWKGSGNWNRDWRRDNRYDWRGYRNANRNVYRLGTYHAPYRGYSYRRVTAGFYLDTPFFGSRYLIADPWQYRLPPVYGPYRWVRYFDDALLVDVFSGEVVDVIYSFFW